MYKDFGMMDEADIKLVIDDEVTHAATGGNGVDSINRLHPEKYLAQAKKALLVIYASEGTTAEEIESTLSAFRKLTPTDTLFLYTITEDDLKKSKRLELYVK